MHPVEHRVTDSVLLVFSFLCFCLVVNLFNGQLSDSHSQTYLINHIQNKQTNLQAAGNARKMKIVSGSHNHGEPGEYKLDFSY